MDVQELCPQGHAIRSSLDRHSDGWCRLCRRAANERHRLKQRAALEFVKALEARGVRFVDGDRPVSVDELADALVANYTE